jgi:serine/threonine-protein kinase
VVDAGDLGVGAVLASRYRLDVVLGEGASSTVYAATQLALGRPVAVKLLHARQRTAHAHERFLREAQAVSRLAHPDVVQIYDFGIDEPSDRAFLVLEQVRGVTLVERLRARGPADEATATRWLGQVARALAHAHARGLVHRDVKPANLMLTDPGDGSPERVKVLDFGLAKMLGEQGPALTAPGRPVGTLEFASPEQVLGLAIDAKSDLFALGCVLYAVLTARAPWSELPLEACAEARRRGGAPALLERLVDGRPPSSALRALLARVMARAPEDRPADAAEVAGALERLAEEASGPATVAARPRVPDADTERGVVSFDPPATAEAEAAPGTRTAPALLAAEVTRTHAHAPSVTTPTAPTLGVAPHALEEPEVERTRTEPDLVPPRPVPEVVLTRTVPMAARPRVLPGGGARRRRLLVGAVALAGAGLAWALWTSTAPSSTASAPSSASPSPVLATPAAPAPIRAVPAPEMAAAAAAPSPERRVTLDTRPSGATVHLGERVLGRTPLVLAGGDTTAALVLKKPGYRDRALTTSTAAERVEVVLERARAPRGAPSTSPSASPYRFW